MRHSSHRISPGLLHRSRGSSSSVRHFPASVRRMLSDLRLTSRVHPAWWHHLYSHPHPAPVPQSTVLPPRYSAYTQADCKSPRMSPYNYGSAYYPAGRDSRPPACDCPTDLFFHHRCHNTFYQKNPIVYPLLHRLIFFLI